MVGALRRGGLWWRRPEPCASHRARCGRLLRHLPRRGLAKEVVALRKAKIPTWMLHSVETAGFTPRQAVEYQTTFDFGRAYAPVGLEPSTCPDRLPEKTLRQQPFRCASDKDGITRALVVDTGEGEQAHNALVPVALGFFLREYLSAESPRDHCS